MRGVAHLRKDKKRKKFKKGIDKKGFACILKKTRNSTRENGVKTTEGERTICEK